MLLPIENIASDIVGIRALNEITQDDYRAMFLPAIADFANRYGRINLIFLVETPLVNFAIGDWWKNAVIEIKNMGKWHKIALLGDAGSVRNYEDSIRLIVPGEFKTFNLNQLPAAIAWIKQMS